MLLKNSTIRPRPPSPASSPRSPPAKTGLTQQPASCYFGLCSFSLFSLCLCLCRRSSYFFHTGPSHASSWPHIGLELSHLKIPNSLSSNLCSFDSVQSSLPCWRIRCVGKTLKQIPGIWLNFGPFSDPPAPKMLKRTGEGADLEAVPKLFSLTLQDRSRKEEGDPK